jgi:predicted adenylyl cyclase CyaB
MREVELKAVVADEDAARGCLVQAGAHLTFAGQLLDRRYDDERGKLARRDEVLRVRAYRGPDGALVSAQLDWKGPTAVDQGYKVREELSTQIGDPETLKGVLERLGLVLVREIDRSIEQYTLGGAAVRFERYHRMDVLVEVEGTPDAIERAIAALGMPRSGFVSAGLPQFVAAFERRTGTRAALCARELAGDYRWGDLES